MSNADDFTKLLKQCLEDYTTDVIEAMDEAAKKNARLAAKELRKTSPIRTGDYRKKWTASKVEDGYIVRNRLPGLTHLLEYGHATADGTGRTKGIPHIKKVEEKYTKKYINDVLEVVMKT